MNIEKIIKAVIIGFPEECHFQYVTIPILKKSVYSFFLLCETSTMILSDIFCHDFEAAIILQKAIYLLLLNCKLVY